MVTVGEVGTGLIRDDVADQGSVVKALLGRALPSGDPCPNDGVFCSEELALPTDPDRPLVFQAVGFADDTPLAVGCTTASVNSDPFYVSLSMLRYVAPAICGDGTLQVGEQCEGVGGPPADDDPVCDTSCRSKEVLLSTDHEGPSGIQITNGPDGSKRAVAIAFSQAPEADIPNPLHAVFQDTNFGATGTGPEVNYRQMTQHFAPVEFPPLLSSQIRLPLENANIPGFDQRSRNQAFPAIATLTDGDFVVAYEDDRLSVTGEVNISFTAISVDTATTSADEIYINNLGENACTSPAVAGGPNDQALVAWTDNDGRRIRGRLWSNDGWLSTSDSTFSAQEGDHPQVAGWNDGWIVAWHGRSNEDNDDIVYVHVDAVGTVGPPKVANAIQEGVQDQPDVAALPNGAFAIVWHDAGRIMMQRFDPSGEPVAGDQVAPVNDGVTAGDGSRPAIRASPLALGFYALAWQNGSGEIRARLTDRSGSYLFNAVDGQSTSFPASRTDIDGNRSLADVAVGGGGYIVFAWQDDAPQHSGIYGRRFPIPVR